MVKKYTNLAILTGTLAMLANSLPLNAADFRTKTEQFEPKEMILAQDVLVPNPTIIIEQNQSHHENIEAGQTPLPEPIPPTPPAPPPLAPRAVAPPVGDIAVSNMDTSLDRIDLGTNITVPRLVLRDAPVEEVLKLLARNAGLNVIFTDASSTEDTQINPTVSLDLEDQSIEDVFNSVLMISGLKANRRGNTIFIGAVLPDGARNLISRTLRLNQVDVESASLYLASQGAEVQRVVVPIQENLGDNGIITRTEEAATLEILTAERAEGSTAALLLTGLKVTGDDRLNSINLIGDPRQVEMATAFLMQLDARRRQVSVNVKIVDVNLNNIQDFNSSFSFGFDDGFFVQDQGSAILNFGGTNPPNAAQTRGSTFYPTIIPFAEAIPGVGDANIFFDRQNAGFSDISQGFNDFSGGRTPYARPGFGTRDNPFQPGLTDVDVQDDGIEYTYELPGLYQFPNRFLLTLEAQVQNGNAKILTDPTLVVQEAQDARVELTQGVVTGVDTQVDPLSGVRTTTPTIEDAGLTLGIRVERIDDNGFINLVVNPEISAPGATQSFNSGQGAVNQITLLNTRKLSSGLVRLRDGQTLILSGIIEDSERNTVTKVPILGDIPVLGALFRKTSSTNERREVIIMLTPKIMDEDAGFGYNYRPGADARELLQDRGLTVPGSEQIP